MNQQVRQEREKRGLSVRAAAQAGGVSNTTWSRFEESGDLTPKMRRAVSQAFGWPAGWPEGDTAEVDQPDDHDVTALMDRMRAILDVTEGRTDSINALTAALRDSTAAHTKLEARITETADGVISAVSEVTAAVLDLRSKVDRIERFVEWREASLQDAQGGRGER